MEKLLLYLQTWSNNSFHKADITEIYWSAVVMCSYGSINSMIANCKAET